MIADVPDSRSLANPCFGAMYGTSILAGTSHIVLVAYHPVDRSATSQNSSTWLQVIHSASARWRSDSNLTNQETNDLHSAIVESWKRNHGIVVVHGLVGVEVAVE